MHTHKNRTSAAGHTRLAAVLTPSRLGHPYIEDISQIHMPRTPHPMHATPVSLWNTKVFFLSHSFHCHPHQQRQAGRALVVNGHSGRLLQWYIQHPAMGFLAEHPSCHAATQLLATPARRSPLGCQPRHAGRRHPARATTGVAPLGRQAVCVGAKVDAIVMPPRSRGSL